MEKPKLNNVVILTSIFCFLGWLVWLTHTQVDRDIVKLKNLIFETNTKAWSSNEGYELRFKNKIAIVVNRTTKEVEKKLRLPTLDKVNYETLEGKEKIIFTNQGTDPYNVLLHGGEIILKSWFGRERFLWIHCTGLPTEEKMTDKTLKISINEQQGLRPPPFILASFLSGNPV